MAATEEIVVYQPGKVGSSAIMYALQRAGFTVSHVHLLNETRLRALSDGRAKNGETHPPFIDEAFRIRREYIEAGRPVRIVSAVRDPVARNLSAFFENIGSYCPNWRKLVKTNPDEIAARFFRDYPHHVMTDWFTEEFNAVLEIDVYAHPFRYELGYGKYASQKAEAIVVRAEDDNLTKTTALCEFLNIADLNLKDENQGKLRLWGDAYKKVKKSIQFPEEYLDRMYDSDMARYFYTNDERQAFRKRHARADA